MRVEVFSDLKSLRDAAAELFIKIGKAAIQQDKSFTVALSGGSTPKALYQLLASNKFKDKIDWSKTFFFFGDERNVLPTDEESNFRMANENLFAALGGNATVKERVGFGAFDPLLDNHSVSVLNIFRWPTEIENPQEIAEEYETAISVFFALDEVKRFPRFDLILLGMGADGHTASLFPFTEALHETEKIAVANYVEKLNDWRFTLTFPVINHAKNVMFLVTGAEKAETLRDVLEGEFQPEKLPSQKVKPADGNLFWLADESAAGLLGKSLKS